MTLENMLLPEKSTLIIGKTGIGKTKQFKEWMNDFGVDEYSYNIGKSYYKQLHNKRVGYFTEQDLILCFSKLDDYDSLIRKIDCVNILFLDELFNLYNWNNIRKQDYILSRYYSFWDFLYCNREIKVIGNSNHRITRIFPEIEDSFLRRIDEVFTHVIEL
ncbi:MAG: hypothetical protein L6Q54_11520 [Leptospiraceae bacterium]|nr:hypothetical protein [Leptospiraceae bacterium]